MLRLCSSLSALCKTGAFRHSQCCLTTVPDMPACDFTPKPYTGPSPDKMLEMRKKHVNPAMFLYYKKPLMIHQGRMQYLYDQDNRRYLDLFAGIVTVSVGHCHPKVSRAAQEQLDTLWHTTNIYKHPGIHEYAEQLSSKLPGDLKVVYFVNSGSEANDLAMLMSRLYTGHWDILSLRNAYHGASPNLMGVTSLSTWNYSTPTGFGVHSAVNPDVYRGPWGGANCRDSPVQTNRSCECSPGECEACDKYVEQLDDVIRHCIPKGRVAAMYCESIQGVGGTVQFPRGYVKRAAQSVRAQGGLFISDEVQTGFGRLGSHYWGFETHDIVPDIVTMAKGIGNGFPLGAVVTTPAIAATMSAALHFNTYGGNPVACAVGSAVLDVIEEAGMQQNCATLGTRLLTALGHMRDDFDFVGDVRGKGLMTGVELVTDQASRSPMPAEQVGAIFEDIKDMGCLCGKGGLYGNVLRIKPPMCISADDIEFAIAVFRRAFEQHQQRHS